MMTTTRTLRVKTNYIHMYMYVARLRAHRIKRTIRRHRRRVTTPLIHFMYIHVHLLGCCAVALPTITRLYARFAYIAYRVQPALSSNLF